MVCISECAGIIELKMFSVSIPNTMNREIIPAMIAILHFLIVQLATHRIVTYVLLASLDLDILISRKIRK